MQTQSSSSEGEEGGDNGGSCQHTGSYSDPEGSCQFIFVNWQDQLQIMTVCNLLSGTD
jgi:hypothetical protein